MQGQGSTNGPLPEALEFEGRFMSSCPITDNPFWWHREQNPLEQQLPDFIPIHNDTIASHQNLVAQSGWSVEGLNLSQANSSNLKNGSGYSEQIDFGRTSTVNTFAGTGSGSNNLPYQSTMGTYEGNSNGNVSNHNLNLPVFVENSVNEFSSRDFHTNALRSGHASTENITTASSSSHRSMNFLRTGIIIREQNNNGPDSAVVTTDSSDKRKSPEGNWDQSSAISSKRSVQIACSSGLHAASSSYSPGSGFNISSSSASVFGNGSLGSLSSGTVPPPRSSVFDSPPISGTGRSDRNIHPNFLSRTNTSVQDSLPANFALSETGISHNSHGVVQRPRLVLPPPQGIGRTNVQNHPISVNRLVTSRQGVHLSRHHNGSSTIPRNSSGPVFTMGTTQMEEPGLRNSTQNLQLPVIAPTVGSRNVAHNAITFRTSGGNAIISTNAALGTPSDPNPSLGVPAPNLVSNSYRRRRMEQIRQALLDVDSEVSTINHPGVHLGMTPESRQRLLSRARHMIAVYRGGRDIPPYEGGADVRQSLFSALASIHDQHRDMRLDVDNMSYEELLELGERIGDVKTGLSEKTVMNSLKHTKYTSIIKSNNPNAEPCSVCQEEYAEGEDLGTLDCGHEYHTNCIKQWLVLKNSCPICKAAVSSSK
ncbi:unnamed protein product [Rhodiola kirilowii]